MDNIIEIRGLEKTFKSGDIETHALSGIDLTGKRSEWLAIMGRSGAGKSTLMYLTSLLDDSTGGTIVIDGKDGPAMSDKEKTLCRLRKFGYVFQNSALLPEWPAPETVFLPLLMENIAE